MASYSMRNICWVVSWRARNELVITRVSKCSHFKINSSTLTIKASTTSFNFLRFLRRPSFVHLSYESPAPVVWTQFPTSTRLPENSGPSVAPCIPPTDHSNMYVPVKRLGCQESQHFKCVERQQWRLGGVHAVKLLTNALANQTIKPKSSPPGKEGVRALRAHSSSSGLTKSFDPPSGKTQVRVRASYSLCTFPTESSVTTSSAERSACERSGACS